MDRTTFAAAYGALIMVAAGCSTTSTGPDHGGADASMDAARIRDGDVDVEVEVDAGPSVPCLKGADCMSGQVCCLANEALICQAGPCPNAPPFGMPAVDDAASTPQQLCATAAECLVAGDICEGDDTPGPWKFCRPPPENDGGACWESGGRCYAAGVTCAEVVAFSDCPSAGVCCVGPITNPDGGDASPADASVTDAGAE
jgi:hypothetical protein